MDKGIYNIPTNLRGFDTLTREIKLASCLILHKENGVVFFCHIKDGPEVKTAKDLTIGDYKPTHPAYYVFKIQAIQKDVELIKAIVDSAPYKKLLKVKKPFALNLSKFDLLVDKVEEEATLAKIAPIDALRYKLEDEEVFYSLVAEPEAEYGNQ